MPVNGHTAQTGTLSPQTKIQAASGLFFLDLSKVGDGYSGTQGRTLLREVEIWPYTLSKWLVTGSFPMKTESITAKESVVVTEVTRERREGDGIPYIEKGLETLLVGLGQRRRLLRKGPGMS